MIKKLFYKICILSKRIFRKRRSFVLMYHSFKREDIFFNVKESDFKKQINFLMEKGYKFVSVEELLNNVKNKKDVYGYIAMTFDDGHVDFVDIALPILEQKNIPASLFWPTGIPNDMLPVSSGKFCSILNTDQIRKISDSPILEFGSHGVSHKEFTKIKLSEAEEEIMDSKNTLSDITGRKIKYLAFPRGKYNKEILDLSKKYFDACFSVEEGFISHKTNMLSVPRISVDSTVTLQKLDAKMSYLYAIVSKWKRLLS